MSDYTRPACSSNHTQQLFTNFIAHTTKQSRPMRRPVRTSRHPAQIGRLGLSLALCAALSSCAGLGDELPPDATGSAIYARLCQKCHGAGGRGDGPQAQWKFLPPANFHAPASQAKSDEQLLSIIEHGEIFTPMHSYRGTLTGAQMREVLAYIRLLSQRTR